MCASPRCSPSADPSHSSERRRQEEAVMIDQSLVQSGFDVETLLGERYLTYVLLTAVDAGLIPSSAEVGDPSRLARLQDRTDAERLYVPDFGADGGAGANTQAFDVEIL